MALFFLLLWLLLDALMNRRKIYSGGRQLFVSKKAVFVSFNVLPKKKDEMPYLSRGLRVLSANITKSGLLELAINVTRRTARSRGRRKGKGRGRAVDFKIPRAKNFKIALAPTLRRAASLRHWPKLLWEDLREPIIEGRERVSIIIVLDSSASMMHSETGVISALEAIKKEALRYRDRVSLVVCKGFGAAVVQHPTTNFNLVINKLSRIGMSDFTPLASGMYKGYLLALNEMRRGYTPIIVIISDGNVNVPMARRIGRTFHFIDPAVQSVLDVAEQIARSHIDTLVVNTRHREILYESVGHTLTGTEVLIRVARITKGNYIGIT